MSTTQYAKSDWMEENVLKYFLTTVTAPTRPTTWAVELGTISGDGFTPLSSSATSVANGYPAAMERTTAWSTPASGGSGSSSYYEVFNTSELSFGSSTGTWNGGAAIDGFGVYAKTPAGVAGQLLYYGALDVPRTVAGAGETITIAGSTGAGALKIRER